MMNMPYLPGMQQSNGAPATLPQVQNSNVPGAYGGMAPDMMSKIMSMLIPGGQGQGGSTSGGQSPSMPSASSPPMPTMPGGQSGSSPGTSQVANPNNQFMMSALGKTPGLNPNIYASKVGTPITNTPSTNMQGGTSIMNKPLSWMQNISGGQ